MISILRQNTFKLLLTRNKSSKKAKQVKHRPQNKRLINIMIGLLLKKGGKYVANFLNDIMTKMNLFWKTPGEKKKPINLTTLGI
jgi:hypothetical protein